MLEDGCKAVARQGNDKMPMQQVLDIAEVLDQSMNYAAAEVVS